MNLNCKSVDAFRANDVDKKIVVIKIGGSCLAGGKALKKINQKIIHLKKRDISPIIIVSALKGMTDSLLDIALNGQIQPDSKITNLILSEGEQMSVRVVESTLKSAGLKVKGLLLSDPDFPIITDEGRSDSTILLEETENKIREVILPLLKEEIIPVVPGFVGKTLSGDITTIGRGGSDTTAIVVGKALKSEEVILLKDVPGILSGDPKMVDAPKQLPTMTVEESIDLAFKGGEVICPSSLIYKSDDVKLRITSYDNEDLLEGGTTIIGKLEHQIKIYVKEKKTAVTMIGRRMNELPGLLTELSGVLFGAGINIYSVLTSNFSMCFYVDEVQQKKAMNLLHSLILKNEELSSVVSLPNLSIITIIGKTFLTQLEMLGNIGITLEKENINLIDISTTMGEINLFIGQKDVQKTRQILEGLF